MAILFINCFDKLNENNKMKGDFYSLNLTEQYELLKKRIPSYKTKTNFRDFMESCFQPDLIKRYYISFPNFERKITTVGELNFLNNVVIRPELTISMRPYLPSDQNIILIGDIRYGTHDSQFIVKGLQFIDETMESENDISISASASLCFERGRWTNIRANLTDSYFTGDNLLDLTTRCYPVKNPSLVRSTYDKWDEYLNFRQYYLDEQKKKSFILDSSDYLDSYSVSKQVYRSNSLFYDDHLLDNQEYFKKGDMVLLDKKLKGAESFPLIRVCITRNKKEAYADTVTKKDKVIPRVLNQIITLSKDNVLITQIDPQTDGNLAAKGYELGDRFCLLQNDILPEEKIQSIEDNYDKIIENNKESIDRKYDIKIKNELNEVVQNLKNKLTFECETKLKEYQQNLEDSLDNDVLENKDKSVKDLVKQQIDKIEKTKKLKNETKKEYEARLEKKKAEIDIKSYYIQRNELYVNQKSIELFKNLNNEVTKFSKEKEEDLKNKYAINIKNEKDEVINTLKQKRKEEIESIKENETMICYSLYFKVNEFRDIDKEDIKIINECQFLCFDARADKAKIERQRRNLDSFFKGNIKNPYLAKYLFEPETLHFINTSKADWKWYLPKLNEKQKEAVYKAVSSNGLFLLQGPPGTGKTQVIAEIVGHLVTQGKKVLISSETHKAIDNVFERLPKIADIVPVRLMGQKSNKQNNYTVRYLVDNFYKNITDSMIKLITSYKNFNEYKDNFDTEYQKLNLLQDKLIKSQKVFNDLRDKISKIEKDSELINEKIKKIDDEIFSYSEAKDNLKRTIRHIQNYNLNFDDDINTIDIAEFSKKLSDLIDSSKIISTDYNFLTNVNLADVKNELINYDPNNAEIILNAKLSNLKKEISSIQDEQLPYDEDSTEFQELEAKRKEKLREYKSLTKDKSKHNDDRLIDRIFTANYLSKESDIAYSYLEKIINNINDLVNESIEKVNVKIKDKELDISKKDDEKQDLKLEIRRNTAKVHEIIDSDDYQAIDTLDTTLKSKITDFFKKFEILRSYKDIDEALTIIKEEFDKLNNNFEEKKKENEQKIPMYEKITKYLSQQDIIDKDREKYTKELFDRANVIGITCTSSDRFRNDRKGELQEFNLDSIDIKTIGIDVVIIDEVSKSSFIDLLIPILYGKTVILVGDHRQLPPMYDLAKLREEEIEGLDSEYISVEKNKRFTELCQECIFKTLFEKIPNDYKTMLLQQYRCHEDIMRVFNHFYFGQLQLGDPIGQNNEKAHNIDLYNNGIRIIDKDKHIYFINSTAEEARDNNSTSIYNMGEVKVIISLLKKFKNYKMSHPNGQRLSLGIISTYGDQIGKIKYKLNQSSVRISDFDVNDEPCIINTVDEFQGDERDIIILTTVRNPHDFAKSDPGFITAYQRINVALSRARRLLIIVGNEDYLEKRGVITLPSIDGHTPPKNNFHVYKEILSTISTYGKKLQDVDVLDEKEGN